MTYHCACNNKEAECEYPKCHNGEWDARQHDQNPSREIEMDVTKKRDSSKPAEEQGVFHKFDVRRVDGSDQPGGKHHGCRYFVLDLDHDAQDCKATHPALSVDRAWARFCGAFGDGPDAPYPGMIAAFEIHYGQSFRDKAWRTEAACWAAAWHKATEQAAKINPPPPGEPSSNP